MPRCPNPQCQIDYPAGTKQCTNPFCLSILPEALIAGRYRIETMMGRGGMGAVYRASDTFEAEHVAIKILMPSLGNIDLDTATERFRREARYAHQIKHTNIVPVLNFGQDGDIFYITMPLITGGTLKALLKPGQPLPIQQAQRYLNELADAIDAMHQHPQHIIHRDLKPSNLLIHQDDGRLLVTDFGIARAMEDEKRLTMRGGSLGTEHYIAPEQQYGKAEPVSDIYAMGVIAYQMFTGLLPFQAVVNNHASEIPRPSSINNTLPPTIDPVILRAIENEPANRYHSGRAFADAINDALTVGDIWSEETIVDQLPDTVMIQRKENVIIRTIIPENPCGACGRENRNGSRFCRYCGHTLTGPLSPASDAYQVGYTRDAGQAQDNEDELLIVQGISLSLPPPPRSFGLFAIADGLRGPQGRSAGGHEASVLAAETVADVLIPLLATHTEITKPQQNGNHTSIQVQSYVNNADASIQQWIRDTVHRANRVVYHCNADYDTTMASTLTLAFIYNHLLYISSVGDSRAYYYKPASSTQAARFRLLTQDDTLPNNGGSQQTAAGSKNGTVPVMHYRYLGQQYFLSSEIMRHEVEAGDLILLCSNGLWHALEDERINDLLSYGGDLQKLAFRLVESANNAGNIGNISVILAQVS
jgi:serine/threonine protein kinase